MWTSSSALSSGSIGLMLYTMQKKRSKGSERPQLVASIVDTPANTFTRGRVSKASVTGISSFAVIYASGGVRLSRSKPWRQGPTLIASHVAQVLQALRSDRRVAVLLSSPPRFMRTVAGTTAVMTSAEDAFLEFGLLRKLNSAAVITRIDKGAGGQFAEGVVITEDEDDAEWIPTLVDKYFDQHSFSGYILPRTRQFRAVDLLNADDPSDRLNTHLKVLRLGGLYFEDWDDGCSLKVWTRSTDRRRVIRSLHLEELARYLDRKDRLNNGHLLGIPRRVRAL